MPRRDTQEDFVLKHSAKFPNLYTYEKVLYTSSRKYVDVTCPRHGVFSTLPKGMSGCPACKDQLTRGRSTTKLSKFLADVGNRRKDLLPYTVYEPSYTGVSKPLTVTCEVHSTTFEISAANLLYTTNALCPACKQEFGTNQVVYSPFKDLLSQCHVHTEAVLKSQHRLQRTARHIQKFILFCNELHQGKYKYIRGSYIQALQPMRIVCPIHGEFEQCPSDHKKGHGCPKCAGELMSFRQLDTFEDFLGKCSKVGHQRHYTYNEALFTGTSQIIEITCEDCKHVFNRTGTRHLTGQECPNCGPEGGFKTGKSATLYYLCINDGQAYKIGITNHSISYRYSLAEQASFKVLAEFKFSSGLACFKAEQFLLKILKPSKYTGPSLLRAGNTELLITNKLNEIQRILDENYKGMYTTSTT